MDNKIGRLIRQLRKEHKDRLQDLGEKVGYSYGGLAKIERGEVKPSLELLEKIASVYDVPVSYFIGVKQDIPEELPFKPEWIRIIGEAEKRKLTPEEVLQIIEFMDKIKK